MKGRRLVSILALAWLAPGCELPGSSDTSDGGCDDAGQRVNDQCLLVYKELCAQASTRCGMSVPSDCATSAAAQYCCTGSACDAWSCQAPSQVQACMADIETEDCNAIATNAVPSDCTPFSNAQ